MALDERGDGFLIRAAGGLLWRRAGGGWQVAVVHRNRYDDWSLPKGKLKAGESWAAAALREVREETGCAVRPGAFAGALAYPTDRGPKLVRFWHMALVGERAGPVDESEVSAVEWLSPAEARERLQYALERALLEVYDGPDTVTD